MGYQIKKRANIPNEIATTTHMQPRTPTTSCNSCCLAWAARLCLVALCCPVLALCLFGSLLVSGSLSLSLQHVGSVCERCVVLSCLVCCQTQVRACNVRTPGPMLLLVGSVNFLNLWSSYVFPKRTGDERKFEFSIYAISI